MAISAWAQDFEKAIGPALRDAMLKAAEPLIQKALADAEDRMRHRLAEMVVGMVERSYELSMDRDRLLISVNLGSRADR